MTVLSFQNDWITQMTLLYTSKRSLAIWTRIQILSEELNEDQPVSQPEVTAILFIE